MSITIGIGEVGMKLANEFDDKAYLFSTAEQDSFLFKKKKIYQFETIGGSKRFSTGRRIWENKFDELKDVLKNVNNERVHIFSSTSGGSGSSSLEIITRLLLDNNNKVFIFATLPFDEEGLPALPNSVQCLQSLIPLLPRISVMLFDNQIMMKLFESDWVRINSYIVKRSDFVVNLLAKYSLDEYTSQSLDQSEIDSVVYEAGFVDASDSFIEEEEPVFEFGKLDNKTKNLLIAMYVDVGIKSKEGVDKYQTILTNQIQHMSKKVKNARIVSGMLRASVKKSGSSKYSDRAWFLVASGLNPDKYLKHLERMRDKALKKAQAYAEKNKADDLASKKETKMLDI